MQNKITPFLWFDGNAEEAMNFYTSIFKNSKVLSVSRNGDRVFIVSFQLEGQDFIALNGDPAFKFTEAISFFVDCDTQQEVDALWKALSDGGQKSQCGWLKDRFGVSWQIIPKALGEMMADKDPQRAARVRQAMFQMTKIDIAALQKAYNQE